MTRQRQSLELNLNASSLFPHAIKRVRKHFAAFLLNSSFTLFFLLLNVQRPVSFIFAWWATTLSRQWDEGVKKNRKKKCILHNIFLSTTKLRLRHLGIRPTGHAQRAQHCCREQQEIVGQFCPCLQLGIQTLESGIGHYPHLMVTKKMEMKKGWRMPS